jgi:cell division protein YceG involved in septum cleavage
MSDNKLDQVPTVSFEYSTADSVGVIAQEIGEVSTEYFSDTSMMSATTINLTGTVAGNTYTFSSGSTNTITLTDPYEEMEKRLDKLEKLIAEEAEIRASHPAVKMAYDEYRLLLVLANRNLTERD